MAISPPTDIVMDVLRAADPKAVELAKTRLQATQAAARSGEAFPSTEATGPSVAAQAARSGEKDPFQKFEALVLGSFIQSMLPQEAGEAYGGGYAGDMWKSMLAQQLGESVAASGGIGIANRLLADHYRDGELAVPIKGAVDPAARAETDQQTMLSSALVQELQRQAAQTMVGGASSGHSGSTEMSASRGNRK